MKILAPIPIFLVLFAASCGGNNDVPEEPTEVSTKMQERMDALRTEFDEIAKLLPSVGEEVDTIFIKDAKDIGTFTNSETIRLLLLEEPHLISLAGGAEDIEEVKENGDTWLSSGDWEALDAEPLKDHKMYTPRHNDLITSFEDMKYLGVVRFKYYHSGKVNGDEILEDADCGIWFWIVEMETKNLVLCKFLEATSDDRVYSREDDGSPLANNLKQNIIRKIDELIWSFTGKDKFKYIRTGDSEIGAEYLDFGD